jgi:hypothetical protein
MVWLTVPQRQVKEGIDAVIVDSVLAIRKGLTKDEGLEVVKEAPLDQEAKDLEKMVIEEGEGLSRGISAS